ncbi:hypothetical protein LPJ61_004554 [Coemansia biformis]|uniref:Uncharacterized protein n=1 Tax=Coemansia biformis TaxID=1286918 RepID=A0A9W7Y4M3_9FUNG|nr:hypothetical protein LPJ61_004554 [Coemansia biformis]
MVLESRMVEFLPPLSIVARAESLGDKHVLLVRAQCCTANPVRLASLDVAMEGGASDAIGDSRAGRRPVADRGFLLPGECVTVVREIPGSADRAQANVEARYTTTLFDAVARAVQAQIEELAAKHGLSQHRWYLQQLVLAHVRATLDVRATLRDMRVACEPLVHLWEAASMDSAPTARSAMRRMLDELSDAVVGTRLAEDDSGSGGGAMHAAVDLEVERAVVAVTVDNERFCTVYEPAPLAVRVRLTGGSGGERRVWVTLAPRDPGEWLVSGATSREIALRGSAEARLDFVMVPLEVGYLRLPEIICHEYDVPEDHRRRSGVHEADGWHRLHTMSIAKHPSPCALANDRIATVYTVAPEAADSTAPLA